MKPRLGLYMSLCETALTCGTVLITTGFDSTLHHVARTFEDIIPSSKYVRRSAHKYVSIVDVGYNIQ